MHDATSASSSARGAACGLLAAASFGVSAPLAKLLLGSISPVWLAGLLYLGGAAGLWLQRSLMPRSPEAVLRRADLPALAGIVIAGGVLGPVCMLFGLTRVSALTGSLLLNLEAPFTVLLAVSVFREHLGLRAALATGFIFAGALCLRLDAGGAATDGVGALLLMAACLCWALDNNLTQRLSLRDPFAVARVKTLSAGAVNTLLGFAITRAEVPPARSIVLALLLGSISYGASLVLDAYALRLVGAAREAAYFATAPFLGAVVACVLLRDPLHALDGVAMGAMIVGVALLLRERHSHAHVHDVLEHEHLHTHDEHHHHAHQRADPPGEPHSHTHRHDRIEHDHPHVPDAHHRHDH